METKKSKLNEPSGEKSSYGVVRDKEGKVKFDYPPDQAPPQIKMLLTRSDRKSLDMWDGDYVMDAQGLKRIKVTGKNTAKAEDDLVAAGTISIDGVIVGRLDPRIDVPAGSSFKWEE